MLTTNDIIQLQLTEEEIKSCISRTISIQFLDNLRMRHPNVQFDCKLRGYVGELAMRKWLTSNGIQIDETNHLDDDDNIDIDFLIAGKNLELKTSLIPDADQNIKNVIQNRDIKLIRRGGESVSKLRGDIHLQIYFDQKRKAKDQWLKAQDIDLTSKNINYLYDSFLAKAYLEKTYLVAWIDKTTLISKITQLPEYQRCWSFPGSQRQFWKCPLAQSRPPIELIQYLKSN